MAVLKIAVAQINCTVGDIAGNAQKLLAAAAQAHATGADLLLSPELALVGYPPEDLLLRPDLHRACAKQIVTLAQQLPLPTLVGHPEIHGEACFNAASLLRNGQIECVYRKHRLPTYEVFDEARYFTAGSDAGVFEIAGVCCGICICADVWTPDAAIQARDAGAELLLVLNASPYYMHKQAIRQHQLQARAAETGLALIYCNMVGGQDELVFDGASCALDAHGALVLQLPAFVETLGLVEFNNGWLLAGECVSQPELEAMVYRALQLGVKDYMAKNNFPGAIIGLSGGIDSALTLAIAVDALGPDKVRAVMMPSPYTADMSLEDSRAMVRLLGVEYDEIPIAALMQQYAETLAPVMAKFGDKAAGDTTEENLQARIRGMILMALSNRSGRLVLTTGNKSEMAVGYATLYGDMAGGFAVLKDVFKTMVYRLAEWRNSVAAVIPQNIIDRPPSAELKPGQTDQDSLPPYAVLDRIIEAYMEHDQSPGEIIAAGLAENDVRCVVALLKRNEYKRRQAPPGIRISRRAFGKDWRYPITSHYSDEWNQGEKKHEKS